MPATCAYGPVKAVSDWLRANRIDPCDVPIDAEIVIERETTGGGWCIRYTALLRNSDGCLYDDPATDEAARGERTALLVADPPENVQVKLV
jgi:hypothetical protein